MPTKISECNCAPIWADQVYEPFCPDPQLILKGPALVYIQAYGSDSTIMICLGPTVDGLEITNKQEIHKVFHDQGSEALRAWIDQREADISFKLLHNTLSLLYYAMNADTYTVDSTTGEIERICIQGGLLERYWRMEVVIPFVSISGTDWERHGLFPKVTLVESGPFTFKKDSESPIPVKFAMIGAYDISGMECCGVSQQWINVEVV